VKIKPGKLKSKIEIEFYSPEDFERILDLLSGQEIKAQPKNERTFVI